METKNPHLHFSIGNSLKCLERGRQERKFKKVCDFSHFLIVSVIASVHGILGFCLLSAFIVAGRSDYG